MLTVKTQTTRNAWNQLIRLMSKATYSSSSACPYEEIKIPVPWGHIAGKWWGSHNKRPIVGIHGWQDNCGSFDRLAPYIAAHRGFLALDSPGHGLSSQYPLGAFQHAIDHVVTLRRIVQYFNWNKVSLLGHSWGAGTSFLYTTFYPDAVDLLICLDALKPIVFTVNQISSMNENIDSFIKNENLINSKLQRSSYSYDELESKLHEATDKSILLENCKYILDRNIRPSTSETNKFTLNLDPRLKVMFLQNWPKDIILESALRLSCPTFMSYSSERISIFKHLLDGRDVIEIIKKNNKNFEFHTVEGTHHIHLNNPELLAGLLNKFIEKYDVKDTTVENKKEIKIKN